MLLLDTKIRINEEIVIDVTRPVVQGLTVVSNKVVPSIKVCMLCV